MTAIIAPSHIGLNYPLDHPRICYQKPETTVTASSSAPGADPAWLDDGETWSVWKSGGTPDPNLGSFGVLRDHVDLTFSEPNDISYIGIAAHNLDLIQGEGLSSTVWVYFDTGSGFGDPVFESKPNDDSAILFLFDPITVEAVRIQFLTFSEPEIAVAQAGLAMELPRRATYTGLPISESEQTTYRNNKSVRGGILTRTIQGAELSFDMQIANLSEEWRRGDDWKNFVEHVRNTGPFFICPRAIKYPEDIAYAVATDRPKFERSIPNHRVSGQFSLQCVGYKRP